VTFAVITQGKRFVSRLNRRPDLLQANQLNSVICFGIASGWTGHKYDPFTPDAELLQPFAGERAPIFFEAGSQIYRIDPKRKRETLANSRFVTWRDYPHFWLTP